MPPDMLWNAILTAGVGIGGWFINTLYAEIHRLQILLNRTREEMAKEYVTKSEVHADINRVIMRLDNLDVKIERFLEKLVKNN